MQIIREARRFAALMLLVTATIFVSVAHADYREADIGTLQSLMENGELTAEDLTRYYIDRIGRIDENGPGLNSIIEINPDAIDIAKALDQERKASGPRSRMHGIPVILKANIDTADTMETTAGSLALEGHIAPRDAFLVERLRDAGAVILAKANLSEWANFRSSNSSSGWSSIGGQTRNPYDTNRNPCGSSSGSGVAVSANLASVAIGTETDGSVICPASINGIVGIKPTLGLVSRSGIIPIAHSQDTAGPMARTVMDAAILLNGMVGRDAEDPLADEYPDEIPDFASELTTDALHGARIGVIRNYGGAGSDARVEKVFEQSIERLRQQGAEIVDDIELDTEGMNDAEYQVLLYEYKAGLAAYFERANAPVKSLADVIEFNRENAGRVMPIFGQETMLAAEEKGSLSEPEYLEALATSKRISQSIIDGALAEHDLDALVAPSNSPTWLTDHINGDTFDGIFTSSYAAISGYPSITVPSGFIAGLPVGLSFIGGAFTDHQLIRLAHAFEQATKARRSPPVD
jgi:amidase